MITVWALVGAAGALRIYSLLPCEVPQGFHALWCIRGPVEELTVGVLYLLMPSLSVAFLIRERYRIRAGETTASTAIALYSAVVVITGLVEWSGLAWASSIGNEFGLFYGDAGMGIWMLTILNVAWVIVSVPVVGVVLARTKRVEGPPVA